MTPVFMDLETASLADLRMVGGRAYARDPSTKLLCACFHYDDLYHLWVPHECSSVLWPIGLPAESYVVHREFPDVPLDRPWVAHNGDEFDSLVWKAIGPRQPVEWIDSLPKCRLAGLPGPLDVLSKRFLGVGKNEAAVKILMKLCKPGKDGKLPPILPGSLAIVASYNIADVVALKEIWKHVEKYEDPNYAAHRACNERGIRFDSNLAKTLLSLSSANVDRAATRIENLTGGKIKKADLTKRNKVLEWCAEHGLPLKSIRREIVQQLIDEPEELMAELFQEQEIDEC